MAKKNQTKDESLEKMEEAQVTSVHFLEEHKDLISWIVLGILVVIVGAMAVMKYVIEPKALAADNENAKAQVYFMQQNYEAALNGDGAECMGFEAIADEYSMIRQGKLAALYAGICQFKLGNYEEAMAQLKEFDAEDVNIAPAVKQLIGDTYVEMGDLEKAAKAFMGAAKSGNELVAPMSLQKAGVVYLKLGDNKAALDAFNQVKEQYPNSAEAQEIDKYIAVAGVK